MTADLSNGYTSSDARLTLSLHGRKPTDFQVLRSARAFIRPGRTPVKAYINDAAMHDGMCVGFALAHSDQNEIGMHADGTVIATAEVVSLHKEGRYWVITDLAAQYVIASFAKGHGRKSFRRWISSTAIKHPAARMFSAKP